MGVSTYLSLSCTGEHAGRKTSFLRTSSMYREWMESPFLLNKLHIRILGAQHPLPFLLAIAFHTVFTCTLFWWTCGPTTVCKSAQGCVDGLPIVTNLASHHRFPHIAATPHQQVPIVSIVTSTFPLWGRSVLLRRP